MTAVRIEKKVTKEGLSLTDRVRGIIKGTPLSNEEREEIYYESKGK